MPQDESKCDIVPHPWSEIIAGGLRSIAASFPVYASLGQVWSEYETHRTLGRIQELLDKLKAELGTQAGRLSDHLDVPEQCEDFPELLEIAIDKVRKEFVPSKRATYARVLANFVAGGNALEHDDRVALLESLDFLSETDLECLLLFKGKEEAQIGDLQWREMGLKGDASNQIWELSCHLAKLESKGLILRVSQGGGVVHVPKTLTRAAARRQEANYRLLPVGARLIEALS